MATRKYNGHKHHSRRHQSSGEQMNRRRLSKQEEIDLTLDAIDLRDETIDANDKCNHFNPKTNNEPTIAPTIHVNAVEDKCDSKPMIERERNEKNEEPNDVDVSCSQSMHTMDSDSGQSLAVKLNVNQSNSLSTEDNFGKKRGKHLARAEAVRDTSASPPPTQLSDSDEKSSHTLAVVSPNSQSQTGSSNKNKLKAQGSSSGSADRSSPSLSRDSSTENYSDLTGTDVQQFLMETLQKNKKDRVFLLKIEQELNTLVKDSQKSTLKFAQMTSYNRMLVHRVAALFGFEHNVDSAGTSVVVTKSKSTRIPDIRFKDCIKEDSLHEPKKSILKRDSASLEDNGSNGSQVSFDGKEKSPDRQTGSLSDGPRSKSFEEREERYEKARARIFNQDSSSSTEGNDGNSHAVVDSNNSSNILTQRNSSPRSSQSTEDLATKANNWTASEVRQWSSTDSDSSGRLQKNDSKQSQPSAQSKATNSSDSDTTPKSTTLSSSSSSCVGMSLLAPEGSTQEAINLGTGSLPSAKNRPTIAKASSFGGISRNVDNNCINKNSTHSTQLSKSGSFNATNIGHNASPVMSGGANTGNTNRAITPKNNIRQENAHKTQASNTGTVGTVVAHSEPQQRYVSSQPQQPSHPLSSASHHIRYNNWHQNPQNPRNNNRMASIGNGVQWPQPLLNTVNQNYPHFLLQQQNDPNVNHMKETQYLHSGQQVFLSSVPNYGQQSVNNEPQQHLTPIRLIYPNQTQPQMQSQSNLSPFGALLNSPVPHQPVSNQMNSISFPLQSSQSGLNFSGNQSNIQNNAMLSHSYGTPLQVPSNMGTVWIINNGVHPQSNSPMMACPPPANTPPSASIASNIAPFVGMSYQQHYRPTHSSHHNMNPNLSGAQGQSYNRGPTPLLKSQPVVANTQRIMPSNGNHHYLQQQVPDMVDMNGLLGANNYLNRGPVMQQMRRQMPVHSNQGLDVRLMGGQGSSPFQPLLPTPPRQPYFPVQSSAVTVSHRYANANSVNQQTIRSKNNTFSKYKPQNRYHNTNHRNNILVPNASQSGGHYSNT